jgi:hypothetical protein
MKQKLVLISLLLISILTTGCIDIYLDLHINSDGSGRLEITYDFEQIMSRMDEMPDEQRFTPQEICDNFEEDRVEVEDELGFENFECEVDNNKVIISTNIEKDKIKVETNTDGTYTLKVTPEDEIYSLFENIEESDGFEDDVGMSIIYTLYFEGEVTKTNIGEKQQNKVIINLSEEQLDFTNIEIIARKNSKGIINSNSINSQQTIIAGIIVAIIIIAIIIFTTKKQKQQANPQNFTEIKKQQPEQITPTIKKLIEWIHQYEKQYTEQILRETLEKSKEYTKEEIDIAFKNK